MLVVKRDLMRTDGRESSLKPCVMSDVIFLVVIIAAEVVFTSVNVDGYRYFSDVSSTYMIS